MVVGHADLARERVGQRKADALEVRDEPIRILADDRARLAPVLLVDSLRSHRPELCEQKSHHRQVGLVFTHAVDHRLHPLRADALQQRHAPRRVANHRQSLVAETAHDFLREVRTHPVNRAA